YTSLSERLLALSLFPAGIAPLPRRRGIRFSPEALVRVPGRALYIQQGLVSQIAPPSCRVGPGHALRDHLAIGARAAVRKDADAAPVLILLVALRGQVLARYHGGQRLARLLAVRLPRLF